MGEGAGKRGRGSEGKGERGRWWGVGGDGGKMKREGSDEEWEGKGR